MKRALLTLAAAVLGTGCYTSNDHSCDVRTLTVDWTLSDAGGLPRSCAAMSVNTVDVYLDGYGPLTSFCTDGTLTMDNSACTLAAGAHDVLAEGLDASGNIIVRNWVNGVVVPTFGDQVAPTLDLTEGVASISYDATATSCQSGYMWLAVTDDIASSAGPIWYDYVYDATDNPMAFPCASSSPILLNLPKGDHHLIWILDVANPTTTPATIAQDCTDYLIPIAGHDTEVVSPVLTAPGSASACY